MLPQPAARRHPYQLFILTLCLLALAIVTAQVMGGLTGESERLLRYADNVICAIFFADFLHSLATAPDRWRYFRTWGWIDLLSSIPVIDHLRWGRAARVFRVFQIIRGIRATKLIAECFVARRRESAAWTVALVTLVTVVGGATAVLEFERGAEANIRTAEDALWWAMTTITTVGYGDTYPVTAGGRLVASLLMVTGIGLVGALSGLAASWFLAEERAREEGMEQDGGKDVSSQTR